MKRTGFLGVSVKALVAGLFAFALLAAGCEHGPGVSGEEFSEEDFNLLGFNSPPFRAVQITSKIKIELRDE